jgi:transposase
VARLLMEDAEWAFFKPFLIAFRGRGGRPASDHRRILDAIFWIARTGSPWRDLAEEFGKWSSVYRQFKRWRLAGLWELVLDTHRPRSGLAGMTLAEYANRSNENQILNRTSQ